MSLPPRWRSAAVASGTHFLISLAVALGCAALVFGLWYPFPYTQLAGGRELFLIMISVDVVCGPLLTLVVFNPRKPRAELWRDLGIVAVLQIAALGYGLYSVTQARPVFMAFEGNRFRVVVLPEVQVDTLDDAAPEFRALSWSGPRLIGVRLAANTDPNYLESVKLSLAGVHPAFRPQRWVSFDDQREAVLAAAKPIKELRAKHPNASQSIERAVVESRIAEERMGYVPLVAPRTDEWVVLVDLGDARPRAFLPLSGW
jgi:hypothetical protein